ASLAGLATMLVLGRWLLPARTNPADDFDDESRSTFLTGITILEDFDGIGKPIAELGIVRPDGVRLLALRRGGGLTRDRLDETALEAGDRLVVAATREELLSLVARDDVMIGEDRSTFSEEAVVAEAFLAPGRRGTHQRLATMPALRSGQIALLGVNRGRHVAGTSLQDVILRPADRIMVRGEPEAVARLARSHEFVSLTRTETRPFRRHRAPIAIGAAAAVVALAAFGVMPIGAAAFLGVAAIILLGCIDAEEAWSAIDGPLLVLVFAMLAIGLGLQKAGTIDMMVSWVSPLFVAAPPLLFILGLYVMTSTLTELVTNNAVAVIVTPIAILLAMEAGYEPRAAVLAVMAAASASFATPVGYQTNTLVYGAGDYRFSDFVKIGVPMNLVVGLASCLTIWWLWL
ncbi:MAG: SLC13 family permease, partial [Pseudomonadota bacterium]